MYKLKAQTEQRSQVGSQAGAKKLWYLGLLEGRLIGFADGASM